jgi:hypothetical protein
VRQHYSNQLKDEIARLSKRQATSQRNSARDGDPAEKAEFELSL